MGRSRGDRSWARVSLAALVGGTLGAVLLIPLLRDPAGDMLGWITRSSGLGICSSAAAVSLRVDGGRTNIPILSEDEGLRVHLRGIHTLAETTSPLGSSWPAHAERFGNEPQILADIFRRAQAFDEARILESGEIDVGKLSTEDWRRLVASVESRYGTAARDQILDTPFAELAFGFDFQAAADADSRYYLEGQSLSDSEIDLLEFAHLRRLNIERILQRPGPGGRTVVVRCEEQ